MAWPVEVRVRAHTRAFILIYQEYTREHHYLSNDVLVGYNFLMACHLWSINQREKHPSVHPSIKLVNMKPLHISTAQGGGQEIEGGREGWEEKDCSHVSLLRSSCQPVEQPPGT